AIATTPINIFEMGFGTGLNAWLTLLNKPKNGQLFYHSIELFPVEPQLALNLNYREMISDKANVFEKLHQAKWNAVETISENFQLKKEEISLHEVELKENFYHLVYFDAFSPEKQPDLWTVEVFEKLYNAMQ